MNYGSVDRQEREFISCVIRQLPGLHADDKQRWVDDQARLRQALDSALLRDYRREAMELLEKEVKRLGGSQAEIIRCVRDGNPEHLEKVAQMIIGLGRKPIVHG